MSMDEEYIFGAGAQTPDVIQLWESFLNGNLDAWEEIFKLYYRDLYGYGLKLSSCPELTKDSIHELFVTLWERKELLDEVRSVKAYLLASVRRSLLKKIKKDRKYFADQTEQVKYPDKIQFSPEQIIINDEIRGENINDLYEALESLPDRQKEVLWLKYFSGMSYDEIEEILSINYQSIRNHIYRAIKHLREVLDKNIFKIPLSFLPLILLADYWL